MRRTETAGAAGPPDPGPDPGEFSARRWPDWSFWWENGSGGRGRRASVVANAVAVLALVPRVVDAAVAGHGPALTALLVGAGVCYAVGVPLAVWSGPARSRGGRVAVVAVLFALGVTPALLLRSPELLTDCTFAVAVGLMLLPLRWSVPLGLGTVAVQAGWMLLDRGAVDPLPVATLAGVTLVLGMIFALTFAVGHLQAAREQVRFLAVARERERVARDLHDVLGHSLSTMTVKAGLARRMLESAGDAGPVAAEIRDVEDLSRQALADVRATVSGYRTVDLATEIAGARLALGAAGVLADLPTTVDGVDPALHEVFGYVVREAVTNVIRHSGAAHCTVRLDRNRISVTDDGGPATGAPPGNGLTGLTERLAAVSGSLDHGERPGGGFRVVARGPAVPDDRGVAVEQGAAT